MDRFQTISVHGKRFNYDLDPDLIFNYDSQAIEYIYKDPVTSKEMQDTITIEELNKFQRDVLMEKIQSVLCCKQEDQPVLLIIALGDDDANHVYWYTILKKRFTQPQSLLPIKGDISQASISTVPFNAVYKGYLEEYSAVTTYALVITTVTGENTLLMICLDKKRQKPPMFQEKFETPEDIGHCTAICILPPEDDDMRDGLGDPRIILGFSKGSILIYRLRVSLYSRTQRLRPPKDISEFVEFPGYPIAHISCARLYNSLALAVAFAQEKPTGKSQFKYSKPYIKLLETHGDSTVKQRKIINPPSNTFSPSVIETKLIPSSASTSNSQLQLSVIFFDERSSQFDLNIWHVTPGKITESLALTIDQLACLRIMTNKKSVRQSLKFSGNGYLLNQPQKIASIILGESKDEDQPPSKSKVPEKGPQQQHPKQEVSESKEEPSPTKRRRRPINQNETWDELSASSLSSSEDGRKRKKRNIPVVVTHDDSPTNSENEEGKEEGPRSIVTATSPSAEPLSSISDLEDEAMMDHISDAEKTNQLDRQNTIVSTITHQELHAESLKDQQTDDDNARTISTKEDSMLLLDDDDHNEPTKHNESEDQIAVENDRSIEDNQLDKTVRHPMVEKLESIEIEVIETASEHLEPEEIQIPEKLRPEETQTNEEDDAYPRKVNSIDINTAGTSKSNDGSDNTDHGNDDDNYVEYDTYDPTGVDDDDYLNYDVKADFVSLPKDNEGVFVILSSEDEEEKEEAESQDEQEIDSIVNHAVAEPLSVEEDQSEASLIAEQDPLMNHSLLDQGDIQFISGGELYIGTDQVSTTTSAIPETESQSAVQPSLNYIPVSNDDLLRLLDEPVSHDTNVQTSNPTNSLLSLLMEDHTVNQSDNGTPALSVDYPITTFPNITVASSPSSSKSTTEPPMTEEEEHEARMSKIALDVAEMCFGTSEIDLDTLLSQQRDKMGNYCWESKDHELKLFMMRYCSNYGMNEAVVMLGRSLLSENEKCFMSPSETKECKSILKRHLFRVHPSLRDGDIINPFSEQAQKDILQMRENYFKQEISISSNFYQSEQGKSYIDYYRFGTRFF